jgi:hypothetical protein
MSVVARILILSALALARPPRAVVPAPGVFLVAKPSIDGGPFRQSVVLLLAHGGEGTLGVIVNRATDIPLSKVLSELDADAMGDPPEPRPRGLDGLVFLFKSDDRPRTRGA